MSTKWWGIAIILRSLFLYLLFTSNAFALPQVISACLWNADMAAAIQYGRQYEKEKNILYHRNTVEYVLSRDGQPRWFVLRVLEIFDYVWKEFLVENTISMVYKSTYNKCIKNYKNPVDIFY